MQPVVLEGLPVILGLPHLDVAQAAFGPVGQVRDQAGRALRAEALLDLGVDLGGDRHLVGERVGHGVRPSELTRSCFGSILLSSVAWVPLASAGTTRAGAVRT